MKLADASVWLSFFVIFFSVHEALTNGMLTHTHLATSRITGPLLLLHLANWGFLFMKSLAPELTATGERASRSFREERGTCRQSLWHCDCWHNTYLHFTLSTTRNGLESSTSWSLTIYWRRSRVRVRDRGCRSKVGYSDLSNMAQSISLDS